MTAIAIRQTLTALVNQRRKVFAMPKYIVAHNAANQRSLNNLSNNVGFLSRCDKEEAWVRLVVRMETDILNLLPGKKFKKQRERIAAMIEECKKQMN